MVVLQYIFNNKIILGSYSRSIIAKAMNEYHTKTCVRFVPRDTRKHRDYIYIHADDGIFIIFFNKISYKNFVDI